MALCLTDHNAFRNIFHGQARAEHHCQQKQRYSISAAGAGTASPHAAAAGQKQITTSCSRAGTTSPQAATGAGRASPHAAAAGAETASPRAAAGAGRTEAAGTGHHQQQQRQNNRNYDGYLGKRTDLNSRLDLGSRRRRGDGEIVIGKTFVQLRW